MFIDFIIPNRSTANAARDYFLIHPRNIETIAEVLAVHFDRFGFNRDIPRDLREILRGGGKAIFKEALSIAAGRWLESQEDPDADSMAYMRRD